MLWRQIHLLSLDSEGGAATVHSHPVLLVSSLILKDTQAAETSAAFDFTASDFIFSSRLSMASLSINRLSGYMISFPFVMMNI